MFVFSVDGDTHRDIEKRLCKPVVTGENFEGLIGKEREKWGSEKTGECPNFLKRVLNGYTVKPVNLDK